MQRGFTVVEAFHGDVVDESALCAALASGQLRGAGLDVYSTEPPRPDHPLFRLDNVVVMPHAGGGVFDNVPVVMGHAFGILRRLLAGQDLPAADVVVAPAPRAATTGIEIR